ncbi:hypothetical protein L3Q82_020710, partial [Scortum barcoo]
MCFVDLEKAFDRVPRGILWGGSIVWGPGPLLRAVWSLYYDRSRSLVRIAGNDVVLLASSSQDLQHVLERFAAECEAAGMRISTSKSEAMVSRPEKGGVPSGVAGRSLRDRVRSSVIREELSRAAAPSHREESAEVAWASMFGCPLDASLGRCSRRVPPEEASGEDPGHAGETMSRLAWERLGIPLEELEEVSGVREVWASLLRLLLTPDPVPDQADENGWMDGW